MHLLHSSSSNQFQSINLTFKQASSSILSNPYIDKQNIEQLTSLQYLRNYTYLQFTLFPQLFPLFISQLTTSQVIDQLNSYVSTFIQFFPETIIYENYYDGSLLSGNTTESNGNREINNQNEKILTQIINLICQKPNYQRQQFGALQQVSHFLSNLNFIDKKQQLHQVQNDINKNPLTNELFKLMSQLVKQMLKTNPHTLCHCPMPKYLFHSIVQSLVKQLQANLTVVEQNNDNFNEQQQEKYYKQYLVQMIKVKTLPFCLEMQQLNELMLNGKTRQFYLFHLDSQDAVGKYMRLIQLVVRLERVIVSGETNNLQRQQFNTNNRLSKDHCPIVQCQSKTLDEISEIIKNCFKSLTKLPKEDGVSSVDIKSSWKVQLTSQQVEKIAKLLTRMKIENNIAEVEKMDVQQRVTKGIQLQQGQWLISEMQQHSHYPQTQTQQLQIPVLTHPQKQQYNRQHLSPQFLLPYFKLTDLVSSQDLRVGVVSQQSITELLTSLYRVNNKTLAEILKLDSSSLQEFSEGLEKTELEANGLLEIIGMIEQRYGVSGWGRSSHKTWARMAKVKHSLFVNLLTTKILTEAISPRNSSNHLSNSQHQSHKHSQLTITDISQMFDEILQFTTKPSTVTNNQSSSHPSLQSVVYMFSGVQLWYEVKQQEQSIKSREDVEKFLDSVIRKYSQQTVKIPEQQIVFVSWIIGLFQMFRECGNDKRSLTVTNQHVSAMLSKFTQSSNVESLVNLTPCLYSYLQLLMIRLTGYCLPDSKAGSNNIEVDTSEKMSQANNNNQPHSFNNIFNQNIYKLPLWKVLSSKGQTLSAQYIMDCVNSEILQRLHKTTLPPVSEQDKENFVVDLNESIVLENPSTTLSPQPEQAVIKIYQFFLVLKCKYQRLNDFKHQLALRNKRAHHQRQDHSIQTEPKFQQSQLEQCGFQNIWKNTAQLSFLFMLEFTTTLWQSFVAFKHLHQQFSQFSTHHNNLFTHFTPPLTSLCSHLTQSLHHLTSMIESNIISSMLLLYKLSPPQVDYLVRMQNLQASEENKERVLERIKVVNKILDELIGLGMFGVSYVQWMLIETRFKLEVINSSKDSSISLISMQSPKHTSTFDFLRLTVLLSWLTEHNQSFQVNFFELQSRLQSNIQPTENTGQSIFSQEKFPKLQLSLRTRSELHSLSSYEFLEFIYEYVPFDIQSQREEKKLFDLSVEIVSKEENHQGFSAQKKDKIRFNRVCQYLTNIRKDCQEDIIKKQDIRERQ